MIPISLLRKIDRWLRDHSPVWCVRCRRVMTAKNARYHLTTIGAVATLCPNCERELYHPWERD
jgi:hypothetical protein